MAEYKIQGETLTAIADALRSKTGATAKLTPAQMAVEIEEIVTGDNLPNAEDAFFGTLSVTLEKAFDINATADSNSRLNSGIAFSVLADVAVYEIRYSGANIVHEFAIWDSAGVMLWSKTVTPSQEPTIVFAEPFVLRGGSSYTISLRKTGDMSYKYSGVTAVSNKISNPKHVYCSYNDGLVCPTKTYSYGFPFEVYIGDAITESVVTEYKVQTDTMNALADAIREKAGVETTVSPAQMIAIVDAVNLNLQEKTVTPTTEVQEVTPDAGYFGLSKVTVNAAEGGGEPVLPDNARLYYIGHAAPSVGDMSFTSSASGILL